MSVPLPEKKRPCKRRIILILSDRHLKFLRGASKGVSLPMHIRGPSPNGIYVYFGRLCLFSSVKRSGSNFSGFGKYVGSWCRANTGIKIPVPTGSLIFPFPLGAGSS